MRAIPVSKFKATCLATMEEVRRSGEPVLITKRGEAICEIVPTSRPAAAKRRLGGMAGSATIAGDIVAPVLPPSAWEALSD